MSFRKTGSKEQIEIPKEVMDRIWKDREDYLNGIGKTYTWEEVKEMIHNKEKKRSVFYINWAFVEFLFSFILFLVFSYRSNAQETASIIIRGKLFKAHLDLSGFFLLNGKRDTILKLDPDCFMNYAFKDFNKDGYKDLFLEWAGNKGGTYGSMYSIYVFDTLANTFKEIKNFEDYPDAQQVKGSKYYYSYKRTGCSDQTWISDLFYIKNNVAVKAGTIKGEDCGVNDGIYIYKIKRGKEKLFKSFPLATLFNYVDNKQGFVKQYWTKNCQHFNK